MKKITMVGGIFAICFLMSMQGKAQQGYSLIYDLYYQLTLYPEQGDQLISNNTALFDSRFYSCLSVVQQRFLQAAKQHMDMCNGYIDPYMKAECEKNNEAAKFWRWTREIRSVCRGEILWSETLTGQASIIGKSQLESLIPGQYEQIVKNMLPKWRPFLVCE